MDLRSQARMIGGPKLADGAPTTVWNARNTQISVCFHEDYLDEMESGFDRMDWAKLTAQHGAYAVEKPWKYVSEIAEMLLAGELSDILADYRCGSCEALLEDAKEANYHRCD